MFRSQLPAAILCSAALAFTGCRLWQDSAWQTAIHNPVAPRVDATLEPLVRRLSGDLWRENRTWSPYEAISAGSHPKHQMGRRRWLFDQKPVSAVLDELDALPSALSDQNRTKPKDVSRSDDKNRLAKKPVAKQPVDKKPVDKKPGDHNKKPGDEKPTTTESTETIFTDTIFTDTAPANRSPEPDHETPGEDESHSWPWDGFWPLGIGELLDELESENGPTSRAKEQNTLRHAEQSSRNRHLAVLSRRDDLIGWNAAILWSLRDPDEAQTVAHVLEHLVTKPPRYVPSPKEADADWNAPTKKAQPGQKPDRSKSGTDQSKGPLKSENKLSEPKRTALPVRISPSMRAAAAEAWCLVLVNGSGTPVENLEPVGRLLTRADLPDRIRGELYRGLARWVSPDSIPRLTNAMRQLDGRRSAPPEVRRAAIETCLIHALCHHQPSPTDKTSVEFDGSAWPATIANCQYDNQDSRVRLTYGRWLVAVRHPQAFDILKSQTRDKEIRVRDEAQFSLGRLGTEDARLELHRYAKSPQTRARAIAVKGLSNWGAQEIAKFASDPSYYVRKTAALALGRHPNKKSSMLLRDLLTDQNNEVQLASLEAINDWPDDQAIPLLLHALQEGALQTRQDGFEQLQRRKDFNRSFPFGDSSEESSEQRALAVKRLVVEEKLPHLSLDQWREDRLTHRKPPSEQQVAEVRSALNALLNHPPNSSEYVFVMQQLAQLRPGDVSIIEKYLDGSTDAHSEVIYREVLPALSPAYEALQLLQNPDVIQRRKGAQMLANQGREASLSRQAVRALQRRMQAEPDVLVWRFIMSAVGNDATDDSAQIAFLALENTWPDVRDLGCRYIARHGIPGHAKRLLPILNNRSKRYKNVLLAAIEAAGRCRNPIVINDIQSGDGSPPARGLRSLLTDSDRRVRVAAAVSLSQLGDREGMNELIRLSADQNATTRESVISEMGRTGQARFVGHLILLGWTESNQKVKREILKSLERLTPVEKRPPRLLDETDYDVKIDLWNGWWQQSNRSTATGNPVKPFPMRREEGGRLSVSAVIDNRPLSK